MLLVSYIMALSCRTPLYSPIESSYFDHYTFFSIIYLAECLKEFIETILLIKFDGIIEVTEMFHALTTFLFVAGMIFQETVMETTEPLRYATNNECLQFKKDDLKEFYASDWISVGTTGLALLCTLYLVIELIAIEFLGSKRFENFSNFKIFTEAYEIEKKYFFCHDL